MSIIVNVGEAKTRLSELLALAEAGEDVVIARNKQPIVKLAAIKPKLDFDELSRRFKALRDQAKPVTTDEIIAWRDEGRRY